MAQSKKTPKTADHTKSQSDTLEALALEAERLEAMSPRVVSTKPHQSGRINRPPEDRLGLRIKESRESKRMTQGELAQLTTSLDSDDVGVSRAVISMYESGKNRPSPKELRLLCEALQITPNYLIYGDEEPFHTTQNYARLGTRGRGSDPEVYAWLAYVMSTIHHNHYDAVMKLVLDLARGWDKSFDQGLQERANERLLDMAKGLAELQALRAQSAQKPNT